MPMGYMAMAVPSGNITTPTKPWIWDTGAAHHIVADKGYFTSLRMYQPGETPYVYQTASIKDGRTQGYGSVKLRLRDLHGKPIEIQFDAYYNPTMKFNLYCGIIPVSD
ncbi:hypothetical protein BDW72DRAFT_199813 [Aspergillus terricola var. indicus]